MRWYDPNGVALTSSTVASGSAGSVTTIWQKKGKTVTAPVGADEAAIDLYFTYGTGWVAYDDVTFKAGPSGSNLAPDPGFEDGDGWTDKVWSVYGEATSHWRGSWGFGEPLSDTYSHVITNTAYGWLESEPIDVEEGRRYDLKAFMKGRVDPDDSRDGWVWTLRVTWFDELGVKIYHENTAGGDPSTVPGTWTEVGREATAPVGAVTAKIRIYLYMGSGWINVDDVTFAPTPMETLYYGFGGETVAMRTGGELYWMVTDHLGSAATVYKADGSQTPVHQYYYPWGNLRGSTEPTVPTDVGFTGQTLDGTTGLIHYNARYYDPAIGRFISADTIVPNPADPQQLNRYAYVTNNPVRYTDPTGHSIDMPGDCGSGETWTGGVCMPNGGGGGASVGMDSVVTASRTGTSGWGRFISPKYWTGFAFDRLTGQDAADHIDLIAEESARAGVDPRLVLAIIRQESEGHQLVGPVSKVWDTGLMWLDASRLRRTSIGIASVQYDTFRTTIERHPDVFNSSEHDWGSLVFDNELSIQVAVWYIADLQDQVAMATDLRQGYAQEWSSTDLIAYGYNAGEGNLGHVLAGDEEWLTPRTSYVARIRDYFAWADGLLCNGQDWSCS